MNANIYVDEKYPLSALTGRFIAASQVVHRGLGLGFEEVIYQRSLGLELPVFDVEFTREVWIDVMYRGQKVGKKRVDFVAGDQTGQIMVEIKAKSQLEDVDYVKTLSYLKASGFEVGLLINFGSKNLEVRRLINSER